jgi:hypothetical protein
MTDELYTGKFGTKQSCPTLSATMEFSSRDWEKLQNPQSGYPVI